MTTSTIAPTPRHDGITITDLTKSYGSTRVLEGITASLAKGKIHGLLGANGVGKTTLLACIANHTFRQAGVITIDGADPRESAEVLARMCFIREDQRYPDEFRLETMLQIAPEFYPAWDAELVARLVERFRLPLQTKTKKLSRGQRSALAITISLASGADYTFLDEPYLGLDATARGIFYEELLSAYAESLAADRPRTFVVSTHLIDEAADLLEEVLIIDSGRVVLAGPTEQALAAAFTARGPKAAVLALSAGRELLTQRTLAGVVEATILGTLTPADEEAARADGVELSLVSLQDFVAAVGESRLGARLSAPLTSESRTSASQTPSSAPDSSVTTRKAQS